MSELKAIAPICCEDEKNYYEDEDSLDICRSCKEWTSPVKCRECGDTVFDSSCCG